MECPQCGQWNFDEALCCQRCGDVFMRRSTPFEADPGLAEDREDYSQSSSLKQQARRARVFLVVAIAWACLIVLYPVAQRSGALELYLPGLAQQASIGGALPGMTALVVVAIWLYVAFLISKTAQSIGLAAMPAFAVSLAPPLWPFALGRMVRKNALLVYAFLLIDAIVLTGAWTLNQTTPWLFAAAVFFLLPLVIYHLLGCAVADLATLLGYNRYLAVLWICGMPYCIFAVLAAGMGAEGFWNFLQAARDPMAGFYSLMGWYEVVPMARCLLYAWPALSLFFWLRAIHENLKYPLYV